MYDFWKYSKQKIPVRADYIFFHKCAYFSSVFEDLKAIWLKILSEQIVWYITYSPRKIFYEEILRSII